MGGRTISQMPLLVVCLVWLGVGRHHLDQSIIEDLEVILDAVQQQAAHKHTPVKIAIVPKPRELSLNNGVFTFTPTTSLCTDHSSTPIANYLSKYIKGDVTTHDCPSGSISLRLNPTATHAHPEFYELEVTEDEIKITANTEAGLFRGTQTLRQILPETIEQRHLEHDIHIPTLKIVDWPAYPWRGMHLDVSRHFFDSDAVKKFIDQMALHKFNRFHWHLTDDQGWRIHIEKFPKLTEIGSQRKGNAGGFYTAEQIREVVEYAKSRYITVIPEIEMPGHVHAALASYPELSCAQNRDLEVWTEWGVSDESLCVCHESAIKFMEDVLLEVAKMFPGNYIHVGGDECVKKQWMECPQCQQLMSRENIRSYDELQAWFTTKISQFLTSHHKRLVGWDEILQGGLSKGATVMAWRGADFGLKSAQLGLDAVMCPLNVCYFDRKYDESDELGRLGVTPLQSTYEFEPSPFHLPSDIRKHILGGQGNVWTEGIQTVEQLDQLVHPRMAALGEVVWTPRTHRSYRDFLSRLRHLEHRYQSLGIGFYKVPDTVQPMDLESVVHHHMAHIGEIKRSANWYRHMFDSKGMPI
eukprot:c2461_g1_i1.p1 GENE.c2461_g1_i1~~c2461_g1_i1.p1  ORF type:complete len:582 (-),score=135.05 c2461_g1_i1:62-1807(-)